jgi:DNA-binding CsgD family transcriptional regulator/tetratricopeptide (TPR) repeat protein
MAASDLVERGRTLFARRAWGEAYAQLAAVDRDAPLAREDLERLAVAAFLVGRDEESADAWSRAHQACVQAGDAPRAARCAFWLAFGLINRGQVARGNGWLARARRLLDEGHHDCVEQGYLLMPAGIEAYVAGDPVTASARFDQAAAIGERFRDPDLLTLARTGQGRAQVHLGQVAAGLALLDEVMVAVTADGVSPILVGATYCSVMDACREVFDLRRAQEWTAALTHWCAAQPDLVPYRGQCLVYRAEIMQRHGAWPDAAAEARRACAWLTQPPDPAAGAAYYQRAELHRLRGEFARAEQAYRRASQLGRTPQPGLALLRLAQGQRDAAAMAIRQAVAEAHDRLSRAQVLAAHAEIMLAVGDVPAARAAADELMAVATDLAAPLLGAVATQATGAVLLAEGDARAAVEALRRAWTAWQELEAPYDAARVRVLIGLAYRALGDHDTAAMELDAARWVFRQLGAVPDAVHVDALVRTSTPQAAGGLTAREVEVLRLVAAGKTNRAIAADLVLSERTVDRHVSNIFAKLGLSSRAAAAAYAVEHSLV